MYQLEHDFHLPSRLCGGGGADKSVLNLEWVEALSGRSAVLLIVELLPRLAVMVVLLSAHIMFIQRRVSSIVVPCSGKVQTSATRGDHHKATSALP